MRAARYLYSFPTRRSSDLIVEKQIEIHVGRQCRGCSRCSTDRGEGAAEKARQQARQGRRVADGRRQRTRRRSEEHTSELQSRGHLVCRLLLEKKKKQQHRE